MVEQINNKPLVSCIIIFFNAKKENFFEEAVESIFAQTYNNWELLLADDGSTDESTLIALQYAQKYHDKVRYVEHEGHQNRGMSATRNLGIRHAKGEYIAFLDADDVWLPHKLEQQVPILESHPEAPMLYGRTQYWFSWMDNNPTLKNMKPRDVDGDYLTITSIEFDRLINPPTQLIIGLQNKDIYACTCSVLIRRNIFEIVGGFEESFRGANEDMVFFSKLFLQFPVYVSSQCWDRYRRHSDSYWGKKLSDRGTGEAKSDPIGRFKYLSWLEAYLYKRDIKDSLVWKELRREIFSYHYPKIYRFLDRILHPHRSVNRLFNKMASKISV